MTKTSRTILTVVVLAAVSLGLVGYALWGQLAETPVVSWGLDGLGWWRTDTDQVGGDGDTGSTGDMSDMAMPDCMSGAVPTQDPGPVKLARAEVHIDSRRQQLIGVRTAPVERRALTQSIRAVGAVGYDETRLADVNVKVAGWIEELYVDYTGQFIEVGQPLFALYSPQLLTTQQEYLLALESRDRLRDSQLADARVYAERLVDAARRRLALWDLPADAVQALEDSRAPSRTMEFRSPVNSMCRWA